MVAATQIVTPQAAPDNAALAAALEEMADLLESQQANPFRVQAYRDAAGVVRHLDQPVWQIVHEQGAKGLGLLPGIGTSLARMLEQLVGTGCCPLLEQLRAGSSPEGVLFTVPGIGRRLSHRIHDELGIHTLSDLEAAAWDGRLARVEGICPRRVRAVRESLAGRFRRPPRFVPTVTEVPPVSELLDVDEEYRRKAAAGRLPVIAPRRFNPQHRAWLPVLHTTRGDRHYTALYSNTARAHELGTTDDWVVIYRDDHAGDGQWTVVTARLGPFRGRRIVRGREAQCASVHGVRYAQQLLPFTN